MHECAARQQSSAGNRRRSVQVGGLALLANGIAHLAEVAWHHPDLVISWGSVGVRLRTHDADALTDKDKTDLAFGLQQFMAGARKFNLRAITRGDLMAANRETEAITGIPYMTEALKVKPGDKVLINGASGGVGTFAVQIAKSMGAEVHGVCSTRNVELVESLGAARVFDYRSEDYTESEEQYDVIIDMVGNHSVGRNQRVLKPDGRLVIVGGPKGNWIAPLIRPLGALFRSLFSSQELSVILAELRTTDLEVLAGLVATGEVRPVLDHSFPLDEAADAIRYSETGRARGKILIRVK